MREILFRGKRIDNGEWVEGCFGQHTSRDAFIIDRPYPTMNGDLSALGFYEVDPSTVGQYTGLTDKNGKRIFEGDIVDGGDYNAEDGYGEIMWDDDTARFVIVGNTNNLLVSFDDYDGNEVEVIGTVYDNPELLEGGQTT